MIMRHGKNVARLIHSPANITRWTALRARRSRAHDHFWLQYRQESDVSYRQNFKAERKRKKGINKGISKDNVAANQTDPELDQTWELTVGIEIHAELDTERKLFSSALTTPTDQPNTNVSLHDLAYPGAQPVFQIGTVVPAIRAAQALRCTIHRKSAFDRKHYFYADQPAGYQITQFYKPFATNGQLRLSARDGLAIGAHEQEVMVGIERVQLEQDTAKSLVAGKATTFLDFNRVSHPLIEIVSRPDIHSPKVASAYVRKVQEMLKAVGAVTAGMESGGLRADVNVSVRKRSASEEQTPLGQRTEIKNLSSLKAIEDAVTAERTRQIQVLEAGGRIESETRGWTLGASETHKLRSKEGEVDYRYMPDPDVPPLIISKELIQMLHDTSPLLPESIIKELQGQYGINRASARTLYQLEDGARLEYLAEVVQLTEEEIEDTSQRSTLRKLAGNFVIHEIPSLLTKHEIEWTVDLVPAEQLATLLILLSSGKLHNHGAKALLGKVFFDIDSARSISVVELAEKDGLLRSSSFDSDSDTANTGMQSSGQKELISGIAHQIFAANEKMANDVLVKKETKKIHFFAGQVMRELGKQGKAKSVDPKHVSDYVHELFWKKYNNNGDS
jgi:aspartyl-tRNA(Asn)/glutamyl-tRNA(Gln) amidotransferase subunit B